MPDVPMVTLVAVDRLRLVLQGPQAYFERFHAGTVMRVGVDALPGTTFDATVVDVRRRASSALEHVSTTGTGA